LRLSLEGQLLPVEQVTNTRAIQWSLTGQEETLAQTKTASEEAAIG